MSMNDFYTKTLGTHKNLKHQYEQLGQKIDRLSSILIAIEDEEITSDLSADYIAYILDSNLSTLEKANYLDQYINAARGTMPFSSLTAKD